jgi:very-short-patch-repair endonuclease
MAMPHPVRHGRDERMRGAPEVAMGARIEEVIGKYAARQHGLVTRSQLLGAGVTADVVAGRLESKRLRPVHRGVYVASPIESPRLREMAAALACGRVPAPGTALASGAALASGTTLAPRTALASGTGAWVSHESAAWLWDVRARPPDGSPVDVTVVGRDRPRRPGIRGHRARRLEAADVGVVEGVPVTSPLRTLVDLARALGGRELERMAARAERLGLVTRAELESALERHRGRRGLAALRAVVRDHGGPAFTRSELEELFLAALRRVRLPAPRVNAMVAGYEVDFHWPRARLVVELDGFAFHGRRYGFENDRRRDARLAAAGIQVIRITYRRLRTEPDAVMVEVGRALALAGV